MSEINRSTPANNGMSYGVGISMSGGLFREPEKSSQAPTLLLVRGAHRNLLILLILIDNELNIGYMLLSQDYLILKIRCCRTRSYIKDMASSPVTRATGL